MKKIITLGLFVLSVASLVGCGGGNSGGTTYKYTYYLNDGTDTVYETKNFKKDSFASHPTNPSREGYTFKGWYLEAECSVKYDVSTLVSEDKDLYAKWVEEGSSGTGSNSSTTLPEGTTYTIDGLPDWITNDGCVLFVWAWEAGAEGSWFTCEYTSGTSCTFKTDKNIVGALVARCVAGTTTPSWQVNDDSVGRIYNKSEDIAITSGVTTYTCSTWYEYYPG